MATSILLAKVIGVFAIIKGVAIFVRRDQLNKIINEAMSNWSILLMLAGMELIVGLFLVNLHNVWVWGWPVVITVLGWLMVIEGASCMLVRKTFFKSLIKDMLAKRGWYVFAAFISLVIGVWLTYVGYWG